MQQVNNSSFYTIGDARKEIDLVLAIVGGSGEQIFVVVVENIHENGGYFPTGELTPFYPDTVLKDTGDSFFVRNITKEDAGEIIKNAN